MGSMCNHYIILQATVVTLFPSAILNSHSLNPKCLFGQAPLHLNTYINMIIGSFRETDETFMFVFYFLKIFNLNQNLHR